MSTDRRSFLRLLGSAFAFLSTGAAPARSRAWALKIHRDTRNTLFGAVGILRPRFRRAPSPFKPYPGQPRRGLPALESTPALPLAEVVRRYTPQARFAPGPLSLPALGRLLYFTNGVTGPTGDGSEELLLRAAPSAGALYAGEVYVVAERVRGLPAGVYYYGVRNHDIVEVRTGSFLDEVGRAVERPEAIANAAAVVLLTNVFARYTWRYANRGYRYALIDSGHIGENLRLASRSAGLAEASALRFHDDRLNALLKLDGREEAVCAVHAVGRPGASLEEPPAQARRFVEKQYAPSDGPPAKGPVIERYHEATGLVPGNAEQGGEPPALASRPLAAPGAAVALPRPDPPPRASVEATIRARRSALLFRPEPIDRRDLGFALEMAQGYAGLQRAPGVDLRLAVHRVKGLDPGLYRYEPQAHRLAPLRQADLTGSLVRTCLGQKMAGAAAVGFLMVARLREAASRSGDRSYRDLLLESGGIGQRIYLAAEATGLVARNLAAFRDDQLNELVGLDGRDEAVIHLTMFGPGR